MRLVFAGTPDPAVTALTHLVDHTGHEVVAVITRPDARRGRGRATYPSPVKAFAVDRGIEVIETTSLRADHPLGGPARERLVALAPECVPVVAFGALIPQDLLDMPRHGFVNLHFSVLPRWRGAAPVQAAIRAGDETTGVSTFRIDAGLDTGDVFATRTCPIGADDTADGLLECLAGLGAELLGQTMDGLERGELAATPQSGEATYAEKMSPESAHVDFGASAVEIDRLVRAYTSQPGAWAMWGDRRVKIGAVRPCGSPPTGSLVPGEVSASRAGLFVGTGGGVLEVLRIQPPGKKMMDAGDFARGARDIDGSVLS